MSRGWAWQCDDCGRTEIVEVGDLLERPPRVWPIYWSQGYRLDAVDADGNLWAAFFGAGEQTTHQFVYCNICSDGRNL